MSECCQRLGVTVHNPGAHLTQPDTMQGKTPGHPPPHTHTPENTVSHVDMRGKLVDRCEIVAV